MRKQSISTPLILVILSVIVSLGWGHPLVQAESNGVSVKAILPKSQHSDHTYYDLRLAPNEEETLELEVHNASDQAEEVQLTVNPGMTNSNGAISYSDALTEKNRDSSLDVAITDLVTLEQTHLTAPANSTTVVKMTVKMPETGFDGMVIGGIYVTSDSQQETSADDDKKSKGMSIENKIAYVVGIKLTQTDTPVKGELVYKKTVAGQSVGRNMVYVHLQNPEKMALNELTYHAEIYKKGGSEALYTSDRTGYRMAPNSTFTYGIGWENKPFKAGQYRLKMTAKSEETGQSWSWDETFKITEAEAKRLNAKAIELDVDYTLTYILGGLGLLLLILVVLVVIAKRKKAARKKKRSRKKKSRPSTR